MPALAFDAQVFYNYKQQLLDLQQTDFEILMLKQHVAAFCIMGEMYERKDESAGGPHQTAPQGELHGHSQK
jgi:hypothetical protein